MSADPFMIRAHVSDWEAHVADYHAASARTRDTHADRRTLAYGSGPDEVLDLFFPANPKPGRSPPIHLFVHGGYWRSFSKDEYAFLADAITHAGAIAAIMDYSLMPKARMAVLVAQVRRAASWLERNAGTFGGDAGALSASGHSAGAHLASLLVCRAAHEPGAALPAIRSVLLVSGIYDLGPIRGSFLQPELQLTEEEVARWSPLNAEPEPKANIAILVGEGETAPFHDQAAAFGQRLRQAGCPGRLTTIPGQDHMTIVRELGRPGSDCAGHLASTIKQSRQSSALG